METGLAIIMDNDLLEKQQPETGETPPSNESPETKVDTQEGSSPGETPPSNEPPDIITVTREDLRPGEMPPKKCGVWFMIFCHFFERFAFNGIKVVLLLFFINYFHWNSNMSISVYHTFSAFFFVTPMAGAIIADLCLGKFYTIITLMICLLMGHVLLLLGAFPHIGGSSVHIGLSILGLILITVGTGVKSCLTAFVGDQFEEEHQKKRKRYLVLIFVFGKLGSLCSSFTTPFIREYVQCFGGDCYALAFGVAAALMVVALGIFIGGTKLYIRLPQEGNDLKNICKCTGRDSNQKVKQLCWIFFLFIPLPMFWAVFEQKGSWWTLQASQMNRHLREGIVLNPEYMQLLNPILVLLFIFILEMGKKCCPCRCPITPLLKLFIGFIFAVLASIAAAVVEILVIKSVMEPAHDKECLLQVLNLVKGEPVSVELTGHNIFPDRFQSFKDPVKYTRLPLGDAHRVLPVSVSQSGVTHQCKLNASESTAYSLILFGKDSVIKCKLEEDHIIKSENREAFIRFINSHAKNITITLESTNLFAVGNHGISETAKVKGGKYVEVTISIEAATHYVELGLLDFGAFYTFVIDGDAEKVVLHKMEEVHASRRHVALQVPQYIFISAAEVLFYITGTEFFYSQAPDGMKSLVQAYWLLNTAFGNLIVLGTENIIWPGKMEKFVVIAIATFVACLLFFFITICCPNPDEVSSNCCSSMLETCHRCPSTCFTMRTTRRRTASTSGSQNQIQLNSMENAPPSN